MPDSKPAFPAHITAEMTLVTPADARRYLDTMHANRSESRLEVAILSDVLKEGQWYGGISPVFFDDKDCPWDGQHRFEAVIKTGLPAYMLFIRGVREEEAEYIDTGRKRTYADSLRIRGVPDYKRRSVVSRHLALYAKYGIEGIRTPASLALTPAEKDAWVDAPGMSEAIKAGEALARAVKANPAYAAYAVFRTVHGEVPDGIDADGFWEKVRSGANLSDLDPALTLRNQLLAGKARFNRSGKIDPRLMELYLLATAWNKHITGERWTRPQPVFETRADGTKVFPASQVPDFLPLDAKRRHIGDLRAAYASVKGKASGE